MALGLNFGTGADNDGETLYSAFTKINTFLSTTTKLTNGDLEVNGLRVGRGNNNNNTNVMLGLVTGNFLSTGTSNTFIGCAAGYTNNTGSVNTYLGRNAGYFMQSGTNNTFLGAESGQSNVNYNNTTCLGYNATALSGNNQVQLGDSSTSTWTYGVVQNRSDLRDKAEVRDTVLGLDFISKLRAVDYKWDMREDYRTEKPSDLNDDATEEEKLAYKIACDNWLESIKLDNLNQDGTHIRTRYHHGLIAQELQDVISETGVDFGGFQDHKVNGGADVLSIGYAELIAPMIKAIQELKSEIELLKSEVELLKAV